LAFWLGLSATNVSKPTAASAQNIDSSHCKAAFASAEYASAAKYCRAEAQATLDNLKKSHLTGDSKAETLGIAALQMRLASVAQSRDGISADAAKASDSLNEARTLIHQALKSCTSNKCRDAMQRGSDRIDSQQDSSS
jgi:hypothetical protein